MLEKFIEKYGPLANRTPLVTQENKLKDLLPVELNELIDAGQGSYMDAFFWVVDPSEYSTLLEEVYTPLKRPSVCFARDAFANLYTWEDDTVYCIDVRHHTWKTVGRKPAVLFNGIMTDWNYFSKQVKTENYFEAKELLALYQAMNAMAISLY